MAQNPYEALAEKNPYESMAEEAPAENTGEPSIADRAKRVAGLGARAVVKGVAGIPTLLAEGLAYPLRALSGGRYFPSPSAVLDRTLTDVGLPAPENAIERFSSDVTSGLSSLGAGLGVAQSVNNAAPLVKSVGQNIASTVTQQPMRQAAGVTTGTAASDIAREKGVGPYGQMAAGMAGSMLPFASQMVPSRMSPEATRTARVASSAQDKGFAIPPSQSRGGFINKTIEGISGKIATAQAASEKNQAVRNNIIKQDLGISKDAAITTDLLSGIRKEAGNAYRRVEGFGAFKTDPQFADDLQRLSATQKVLSDEIPDLANKEILSVAKNLSKPEYSGRTLIELTKAFRDKATAAFKSGESGIGRFWREASDAVEDMMERNLAKSGDTKLLNDFRQARTTIAKTYTVEAALNDATGNVSGAKLAVQLGKKPLSGGMETTARFAKAFPKANQNLETIGSQTGISPLDYSMAIMGSGFGGAHFGIPGAIAGASLPLARPSLRSGILSPMYQKTLGAPNIGGLSPQDAAALGILQGAYRK